MLVRAPAASRAFVRSIPKSSPSNLHPAFTTALPTSKTPITRFCTVALQSSRPTARNALRSTPLGLRSDVFRLQTRSQTQDKSQEQILSQKLKPHPELVSATSTMQSVVGGKNPNPSALDEDTDMAKGIRQDIATIKETFDLSATPREAYVLGLAGVLPYFATSAGTIYCAWEINHAAATGAGFLMSGGMAEAVLHVLEPLQIGYGAVIISFLGAIHWGLEWANFGGRVGYPRYAIGVVAPAVAWPTILMSPTYGLISQFLAFVFLYYADANAARRGWAPSWYGMYRFVLTFIVGASIVASLIGRGEIAHMVGEVPKATDRIKQFRETAAHELSEEEQAGRAAQQQRQEHTGMKTATD